MSGGIIAPRGAQCPGVPRREIQQRKETPVKYELMQSVTIATSGEQGEVIGRAEYVHAEPSYLVRYQAADGRAEEVWWTESALA